MCKVDYKGKILILSGFLHAVEFKRYANMAIDFAFMNQDWMCHTHRVGNSISWRLIMDDDLRLKDNGC